MELAMAWHIKGEYYENCSCTNTCPCTWSSMSVPATNDYCRANLAFQVSEGEVNGVDMSGVTFVIIVDSPALMSEGDWKVGVVVNESCSDDQMNALGAVMSGDIGGPAAMLKDMIGEMLGMERQQITINEEGNDFHITIGENFEYNASIVTNPMTEQPVKIVGMMHPAGEELSVANVHKANNSVMGVSFAGENLSGYRTQFSWAA